MNVNYKKYIFFDTIFPNSVSMTLHEGKNQSEIDFAGEKRQISSPLLD